MSGLSRRGFVKGMAAALPVLSLPGEAGAEPRTEAPLDDALLRALADVVLPSEVGDAGKAQAVAAFQAWLAAYEPVAERNHGYGTGDIEYLPADPSPGWNAQLRALDLESQRRHGSGFVALDVAPRRALVERHVAGNRLPSPIEADHVALGLLAWWCDTPGAHDLAYRARIAPRTCRPLATSSDAPASLDGDA